MRKTLEYVSILLLVLTIYASNCSGYVYWRNATQRNVGSVIPWPKEIEFQNSINYLRVDPNQFTVKIIDSQIRDCDIIKQTVKRYTERQLFFDDVKPSDKDDPHFGKRKELGALGVLYVKSIKGDDLPFSCQSIPPVDMDESYELTIELDDKRASGSLAHLSADSSWGLIRGFETFSQLIFNHRRGSFGIQPVRIRDSPRFKHRGFMLDTARHFIPKKKILEALDAMSYDKLNVFHWHMVDDQSFPYESFTYPQLSRKSAFKQNMIYTQEDVRDIIQYAAVRGIRVMPELDTPGHSYALRHIENFLSECYDPKSGAANGDYGPIDPTKMNAYVVVSKLLKEFASVFYNEPLFHAGGDEVDYDCWRSNPKINNWMSKHNMTGNYAELSNHYIRRLYDLVKFNNKSIVVWQEVFDAGANLPKDSIIHVWKNDPDKYMKEIEKVTQAGYRALLSTCWYLNLIEYGQDWVKFYHCDAAPEAYVPKSKEHLVLGGEICMWSEFVDGSNLISRTWPRASAAAERLWSPRDKMDEHEFKHRLEQHRCRLLNRGLQVEPVNGPGYC